MSSLVVEQLTVQRHEAAGGAPDSILGRIDRVERACESCGSVTADGAAVHRLYLLPDLVRQDEVEWWCWSQYPHDEAG